MKEFGPRGDARPWRPHESATSSKMFGCLFDVIGAGAQSGAHRQFPRLRQSRLHLSDQSGPDSRRLQLQSPGRPTRQGGTHIQGQHIQIVDVDPVQPR